MCSGMTADGGSRGSENCSIVQLDGAGRLEKTFILKMRKLDTTWNLVKVTRRGCGAMCELVKAEGHKPGFKLEVR